MSLPKPSNHINHTVVLKNCLDQNPTHCLKLAFYKIVHSNILCSALESQLLRHVSTLATRESFL